MTIPQASDVQFLPGTGKVFVDNLTDPSGAPTTVLDIDVGFTITGRLELPSRLSGKGVIRLFADQIGGPIDTVVGEAVVELVGTTSPNDGPDLIHPWSINVRSPALPNASTMYQMGLIFVFQAFDAGHEDVGAYLDLGPFLVV